MIECGELKEKNSNNFWKKSVNMWESGEKTCEDENNQWVRLI